MVRDLGAQGAPLLAAVAVCLGGCGDSGDTRGLRERTTQHPASDVRVAGGYRIVGTPIAGVATTTNGITDAIVTIRTNKALPFPDGAVTANIRLDGASGAAPAIRAGDQRSHYCYIQPVDEFPRQAQTGDRVAGSPQPRSSLAATIASAGCG
jgi:hypothetical protein